MDQINEPQNRERSKSATMNLILERKTVIRPRKSNKISLNDERAGVYDMYTKTKKLKILKKKQHGKNRKTRNR